MCQYTHSVSTAVTWNYDHVSLSTLINHLISDCVYSFGHWSYTVYSCRSSLAEIYSNIRNVLELFYEFRLDDKCDEFKRKAMFSAWENTWGSLINYQPWFAGLSIIIE